MDTLTIFIPLLSLLVAASLLLGYKILRNQSLASGQAGTDLISQLNSQISSLQKEREDLANRLTDSKVEQERLRVEAENLKEKLTSQKQEIEQLYVQMRDKFDVLANQILEQKSQQFSTTGKQTIEAVLTPVRESLKNFQEQLRAQHLEGTSQNSMLAERIKQLTELNNQLSNEAANLTKALSSNVKQQGNWGETILDKMLENSGLIKGQHYETQYNIKDSSGSNFFVDVLINLPDNKHIIVDSKVSITAYNEFVSSENSEQQKLALKNIMVSIKSHIDGLSGKNYPSLIGNSSLDFTIMFVPLEGVYTLALTNDNDLWHYAYKKNILLLSPGNLIITLKVIESVWRQHKQNQNALEIARQGGNLYDKVATFIETFEKVGTQIETLQKSYDTASKQLSTGKGNILKRAEDLRQLGVPTNKQIALSTDDETSNL